MTFWLCALRTAVVPAAALVWAAAVVPYGSGGVGPSPAYGVEPSASGTAAVSVPPAPSDPPAPSGPSSSARPAAAPAGLPVVLPPVVAPAPSASRSAPPSRAGSAPGEGRQRPGRHGEDPEKRREVREDGVWPGRTVHRQDGRDVGSVVEGGGQDTRTVPSEAAREGGAAVPRAAARAERAVGPSPRILPLGGGLVLVGLGLGFAFLGLRLRRV